MNFLIFARMPKPVFKRINLSNIIKDNVFLLKEIDSSIKIEYNNDRK